MKLLKRIRVAVVVFALTVIAWGLLYVTASAAECFVVCTTRPVICKVICL